MLSSATTGAQRLILNGEPHFSAARTVTELLSELGTDTARVAVELNGQIVRRGSWDTTALEADARIEVVTFVGGG